MRTLLLLLIPYYCGYSTRRTAAFFNRTPARESPPKLSEPLLPGRTVCSATAGDNTSTQGHDPSRIPHAHSSLNCKHTSRPHPRALLAGANSIHPHRQHRRGVDGHDDHHTPAAAIITAAGSAMQVRSLRWGAPNQKNTWFCAYGLHKNDEPANDNRSQRPARKVLQKPQILDTPFPHGFALVAVVVAESRSRLRARGDATSLGGGGNV